MQYTPKTKTANERGPWQTSTKESWQFNSTEVSTTVASHSLTSHISRLDLCTSRGPIHCNNALALLAKPLILDLLRVGRKVVRLLFNNSLSLELNYLRFLLRNFKGILTVNPFRLINSTRFHKRFFGVFLSKINPRIVRFPLWNRMVCTTASLLWTVDTTERMVWLHLPRYLAAFACRQ